MTGEKRTRLPDRGVQRARRRRRVYVRSSQGLARRRGLADGARIRQRLRGLRRYLAMAARRLILSWEELAVLLQARHHAARTCATTKSSSRSTGRPIGTATGRDVEIFAFDHRMQLEEMEGATPEKIGAFKQLCLEAALKVQDGRPGYGILCDGRARPATRFMRRAGQACGSDDRWNGPGRGRSTLEPELGPDYGGLEEWPRDNVVKVLCFCHPDDDPRTCGRRRRRWCSACSTPLAATVWSSCWRSSPRRSARWTTRPRGSDPAVLRPWCLSRLVEARAR